MIYQGQSHLLHQNGRWNSGSFVAEIPDYSKWLINCHRVLDYQENVMFHEFLSMMIIESGQNPIDWLLHFWLTHLQQGGQIDQKLTAPTHQANLECKRTSFQRRGLLHQFWYRWILFSNNKRLKYNLRLDNSFYFKSSIFISRLVIYCNSLINKNDNCIHWKY